MDRLLALHDALDAGAAAPTARRALAIGDEILGRGLTPVEDLVSELILLMLKIRRHHPGSPEITLLAAGVLALRERQNLPGRIAQAGDFYPVPGRGLVPMELCWAP